MADFSIPFGRDGERRSPTQTEKEQGFPCGPANRALFGMLFHRLEAEVGHVIDFAGLTPTDDRFTQLREAIQALISAATGTADTSQYLLMTQARARLPIYPEIQTTDGKMGVIPNGAGSIRLPGGVTFQHRGIFPVTTAQTDFATDPNKTYHLRWSPSGGFQLKDLASGAYNPGVLVESNSAFDSKYDDMLIARVITNSSNIATVTNLTNLDELFFTGQASGVSGALSGNYSTTFTGSQTLNWSRTPKVAAVTGWHEHGGTQIGMEYGPGVSRSFNRYSVTGTVHTNLNEGTAGNAYVTLPIMGYLNFDVIA